MTSEESTSVVAAVGPMQYGAGNNAGGDPTALTSSAPSGTLSVSNTGSGADALVGEAKAQGHGVVGRSNGCGFPEGCYAGVGVLGENSSSGTGVRGTSVSGHGVDGWSQSSNGVTGSSQQRNGVEGSTPSSWASGVYGENSGTGFGVAGRAHRGTAILADSSSGTALSVQGVARFSRSGRATIAKGKTSVNVTGVPLRADSLILATLNTSAVGVFMQGVWPIWFNNMFEIVINTPAPVDMPVAWLVLN